MKIKKYIDADFMRNKNLKINLFLKYYFDIKTYNLT